MKLTIEYRLLDEGESHKVVVRPFAMTLWERHYNTKVSAMAEGLSMFELAALTLEQAKIDGTYPKDYELDTFLAALDDLNPVEEEAPKDQPAEAP